MRTLNATARTAVQRAKTASASAGATAADGSSSPARIETHLNLNEAQYADIFISQDGAYEVAIYRDYNHCFCNESAYRRVSRGLDHLILTLRNGKWRRYTAPSRESITPADRLVLAALGVTSPKLVSPTR